MLGCKVYDSTKHAYGSQQAWVVATIEVWEIWLSAIRSLSCSLYRPLGPTVILRVYCSFDSSPETGRLWYVIASLFLGWQRLDWPNGPLPAVNFFTGFAIVTCHACCSPGNLLPESGCPSGPSRAPWNIIARLCVCLSVRSINAWASNSSLNGGSTWRPSKARASSGPV